MHIFDSIKAIFLYVATLTILGCGTKTGNAILDGNHDDSGVSKDSESTPIYDTGVNKPLLPQRAQCPTGRWCWVEPQPTGDHYTDVWAASDSDVWAVTITGTIVHYNGSTFELKYQPKDRVEKGSIWGRSAEDVWFVLKFENREATRLLHWNGNTLKDIPQAYDMVTQLGGPQEGSTWAFSLSYPSQYRIVTPKKSEAGTLGNRNFQYIDIWDKKDGKTTDIWASSDSDVWVLFESSRLFHWNGAVWSNVQHINETDKTIKPIGIWGSSASDLWAIYEVYKTDLTRSYERADFFHYDGTRWEKVNVDATPTKPYLGCTPTDHSNLGHKISGTSSSNIYAVSGRCTVRWHWDGKTWTAEAIGKDHMDGLWSLTSTKTSTWAVGPVGFIEKTENSNWSRIVGITQKLFWELNWLSVSQYNDIWTIDYSLIDPDPRYYGVVRHFDGKTWTNMLNIPSDFGVSTILALNPTDVWLGGYTSSGTTKSGCTMHWDGKKWTNQSIPNVEMINIKVAFSTNDVWAKTLQGAYRWNGNEWELFSPLDTVPIADLSGVSSNDMWFVVYEENTKKDPNNFSLLFHWDGQSIQDLTSTLPDRTITAIRAIGPNDLWAVSNYAGYLAHWNGKEWTRYSHVSTLGSFSTNIWSSDSNHVWFLNTIPTDLGGGPGPTDVFSFKSSLLHWNGTALIEEAPFPYQGYIVNISGTGSDDLWVQGANGILLRSSKP